MSRLARSLRDQIADQIRREVLDGELASGTSLREEDLAKRFAVSRRPVREALQQLAVEGCLEARTNAGVRVAEPCVPILLSLFRDVRAQLELFALRQWFSKLAPNDFQPWEDILDRMRRACLIRNILDMAREDFLFHKEIVAKAELPHLTAVWMSVTSRYCLTRPAFGRETLERPLHLHEIHCQLFEVLRGDDLDKAIDHLIRHLPMWMAGPDEFHEPATTPTETTPTES